MKPQQIIPSKTTRHWGCSCSKVAQTRALKLIWEDGTTRIAGTQTPQCPDHGLMFQVPAWTHQFLIASFKTK